MRSYLLYLALSILFFGSLDSAYTMTPILKGFGILDNGKGSLDTAEVNRYARLALKYSSRDRDLKLFKSYIDSAELVAEKADIELTAYLHFTRAQYFFLTSDYNNAGQEAALAMKIAKNQGNDIVLMKTMFFLGRYSLRTGFFQESIDYYKKTISFAEDKKIRGFIPACYLGIADVHKALENETEYRANIEVVIRTALEEDDIWMLQEGYFRLGTSLTAEERDFRRADSLLKLSLEIAYTNKDTNFISLSLANLGWNQYLEKNYEPALKYYTQSLSYSLPGKRLAYSANSYGNIGTIYRDMNDTDNSLKYYLKSIEQAKNGNDIYDMSWVYSDMSEMYLRKKDTANAYLTYVLFKKYSDSLLRTSNSQGLTDARIRYEADSHNKELELLSLRIKNQKLLIYGFTGLFLLALAIGILFISRSKINAKRRLSELNRKISEVTQANLRQQMNPHFIFNTLNSIQYYMYQHDKLATNNYLTKFSSLMRKVLDNSQHTAVPVSDELDALNLYLELEKIRFKDKFDYVINVDEEIDTLLYKIPTMLIQPYVENSICHGLMPGDKKGLIKVDLILKKDYISCTIEDNGIGRKAAQERKNSCGNNHNSLGTQIVSSRLDLVNALYGTSLKTVYTDLNDDNGDGTGTRVEIHIPLLT